jgi:hypothetical protein
MCMHISNITRRSKQTHMNRLVHLCNFVLLKLALPNSCNLVYAIYGCHFTVVIPPRFIVWPNSLICQELNILLCSIFHLSIFMKSILYIRLTHQADFDMAACRP